MLCYEQAVPSCSSRPERPTRHVSPLPLTLSFLSHLSHHHPTNLRPLPTPAYTGYLTNTTFNGQIAQAHSGATIVLEHRFYGLSNPYPNLNTTSLQLHTIPQAIADLDYFAKNVVLPMPGGDAVGPTEVPWILVGGSYSGALTSWTIVA